MQCILEIYIHKIGQKLLRVFEGQCVCIRIVESEPRVDKSATKSMRSYMGVDNNA